LASRNIRPSQFVTTYGVGSLLRIGKLHRIIPSYGSIVQNLRSKPGFAEQDENGRRGLEKFQIIDKKLEKTITGFFENQGQDNVSQIKVFKLPSNADLLLNDGDKLYTTDVFPKWSVCKKHHILRQLEMIQRKWVLNCSMCVEENIKLDSGTGMRFIQACHKGHMDDVDWHKEVHGRGKCDSMEYDWSEEENNFEVSCRECGLKINYNGLKQKSELGHMECSKYWPELNSHDSECFEIKDGIRVETAKLVLKNASNLRISQVVSSLIIPPYAGRLYKMFVEHGEFLIDFATKEYTKNDVINKFEAAKDFLKNKGVNEEFFSVLDESPEDEIKKAISSTLEELKTGPLSERDSEDSEFDQLIQASKRGYPKPLTGEPAEFMVDINKVKKIHSKKFNSDFMIVPIDILHVVKSQVGFRREVKARPEEDQDQFMIRPTGKLIPTYYEERSGTKSTKWFVGKKIKGEGLFIFSPNLNILDDKNESVKKWLDVSGKQNDEELKTKTNPNFVWWHSFAHRLVMDLSIDSGFQSTSIAEKTYSRENNGNQESGILLYAVQEGGDGTLGGLTGMADNFEEIIERSASRITHCSNDPICKGRPFNANRVNGAACHACMLVSETSCGLQNKFLDRNLLLESVNDN
jgi:hypothetical protein